MAGYVRTGGNAGGWTLWCADPRRKLGSSWGDRDSLLDIIRKFVFIAKEEKKDDKGKKYFSESLVFPRYHHVETVVRICRG